MAVTQTGTNGLFTRLGKLFFVAEKIATHQGTSANSLSAEMEDVVDEYNSVDMHMAQDFTVKDAILAQQKNAANIYSSISNIAKRTVIEMVDNDTELNQKTIQQAIEELNEQSGISKDVKGNVFTVGGDDSPTTVAGTGDGKYFTSSENGEGKKFQNLRTGSTRLECIKDAQVSGTAGREVFSTLSDRAISDIRDPEWPGGYGTSHSIAVSDPAYQQQNSVGRNMLANGNFETFTVSNTPDNWTVATGTIGTTITEEGTVVHRGSKALEFVGNGSQLTEITQTFDTAGQTTAKMRPETRYGLCFWVRVDSTISAGVLTVTVQDASGVLDTATIAVTLSGLTDDTWTPKCVTFSTPAVLSTSHKVSVKLTTAATNTGHIYIDGLQVIRMQHLTDSSSFHITIIPGATDFVVDDYVKLGLSKPTTGKFQTFCNKFLGLDKLGLQLKYVVDGSETAADSLIA
jgi:hypothetical protein